MYEPFDTGSFAGSTTPPEAFTPSAAAASTTPPDQFAAAAANPSTTPPEQFAPAAAEQSTTPPEQFATAAGQESTTPPDQFAPAAANPSTTPPTPFAASSGALASEAALAALATATREIGEVLTTVSTAEGESIRAWRLTAGTAVAVPDAIVIPADYHAVDNARFWERIPL